MDNYSPGWMRQIINGSWILFALLLTACSQTPFPTAFSQQVFASQTTTPSKFSPGDQQFFAVVGKAEGPDGVAPLVPTQNSSPALQTQGRALSTPIKLADNIQYTDYVINIAGPGFPAELAENRRPFAQLVYEHFDDLFDFLIFAPESFIEEAELYGSLQVIRNDTQYIGRPIFDNTAGFGSAGKLQGIVFLNLVAHNNHYLLNHELMHRWAVGQEFTGSPFAPCAGGHWGEVGIGRGLIGGRAPELLVDNGDGTITIVAPNDQTGVAIPLELYLAGLLPADQVPDMVVPINVDCDSVEGRLHPEDPTKVIITYQADGLETYTIEDVIDLLGGERIPDVTASQKHFRSAFVVVSETLLAAEELAHFEEYAQYHGRTDTDAPTGWTNSFSQAMQGLATMDFVLVGSEQEHQLYLPVIVTGMAEH